MADLTSACGEDPGNACEWVWNEAHNEKLAKLAQWLVDKPLQILIVIITTWIVAWVLRKVVRRAVRRFILLGGRNPLVVDDPDRRAQRAKTLSGVTASSVGVLVWVAGVLTIMAILGFDVKALALGSAFVGAALGFGAQQVVKDLLAGFQMLVEDQFGVGDTITVLNIEGRVERVSMRTTDVRDSQGTLWHIANGDVRVLGNKSSDYATAVLDVDVTSRVTASEALDVVTTLTAEAAKDPDVASRLLRPPQVVGVQNVLPDRTTIRVTARTKPGEQFAVQRLVRTYMKDGLDAKALSPPVVPPVVSQPST